MPEKLNHTFGTAYFREFRKFKVAVGARFIRTIAKIDMIPLKRLRKVTFLFLATKPMKKLKNAKGPNING